MISRTCCFYLQAGCQSIVLSGGYEDDTDNGDTFYYTGYSTSVFAIFLPYHLIRKGDCVPV